MAWPTKTGSLSAAAKSAVILVSLLIWSNQSVAAPVGDLDRAVRLVEDPDHYTTENVAEALKLLDSAARNKSIRAWALVYKGLLFERLKRPEEALAAYSSIPNSSAASIDARTGISRLRLDRTIQEPFSYEQVRAEIDQLLSQADYGDRDELREDLLFLKGRAEEALNRPAEALAAYRDERREFPLGKNRFAASDASRRLLEARTPLPASVEGTDRLTEAEILISEEEYIRALEQIQKARPLLGGSSEERAKSLLLEEKILRKTGRSREADHLLERIVSGTDGADQALMKLAKAAWGRDNHEEARTQLGRLLTRFPDSRLADEAVYTDGRILEEQKLFADARTAYSRLSASERPTLFKIRAIKRLSWLEYRNGDLRAAAKGFSQMRTAVRRILLGDPSIEGKKKVDGALSRRERNEFADEFSHATYWYAVTAGRLSAAERSSLSDHPSDKIPALESPQEILAVLASRTAAGYYSFLASNRLKRQFTLPADPAECRPPEADSTITELGVGPLESSLTRPLADREIAWRFGKQLKPLDPLTSPPAERVDYWKLLSQRIAQSATYGTARRTVHLAYGAFRTAGWEYAIGRGDTPCLRSIVRSGHPQPYRKIYIEAAKKTKLPESLIYAITRTESHFDPNARSRVGASGLMQLMPETAKMEGLGISERLLDPAVNVRLGSKHLAGLVTAYSSLPEAIAAYNGGRPAVDKWRARYPTLSQEEWVEQIGFPETYDYVRRVLLAEAIYRNL